MNMKPFMLCLVLAMLLMSATARPATDEQPFNQESNVRRSAADKEWRQVVAQCDEKGICRLALKSVTAWPITNLQPFNGAFVLRSAADQQLKTTTGGPTVGENDGCKSYCPLGHFIVCCEWLAQPKRHASA